MTEKEFGVLIAGLKAVYTQPTFLPDKSAIKVWFNMLQDIPYQVASAAAQKYMATEKFPPTIADIREKAAEITMPAEMNMGEMDAWTKVKDAIYEYRFEKPRYQWVDDKSHADHIWNGLPITIRTVYGDKSNLFDLAYKDETGMSVAQSYFFREYRAVLEKLKKQRMIPAQMQEQFAQMQEKPEPPQLPDSENCKETVNCGILERIDTFRRFDDDDNNAIDYGLNELCELYEKREYEPIVYRNAYIREVERFFEPIDGILEIRNVAESYIDYKHRNGWDIQELGVFLAKYSQHKQEYDDGLYDADSHEQLAVCDLY